MHKPAIWHIFVDKYPMEKKENKLPLTTHQPSPQDHNETNNIPVIKENGLVDKKVVETGKVIISKTVSEEKQVLNTPVFHEEVDIKTVAVNRFTDTMPEAVRYEGDTMIIPVIRE